MFSKAVILCEGITEEQALPIFFKEYFGIEPILCGVNFIGIGGQNYKTFLNLIKNLLLPWFIFSDGEKEAIKTVKKAIKVITDKEVEYLKNIVILENNEDYEQHLLASGYADIMISSINDYEHMCACKCEGACVCAENDFFAEYVNTRNHTSSGRCKTDQPKCKECNQDIYDDNFRNYDGDEGKKRAVYDYCTAKGAKAKYAIHIAQHIIKQDDINNRIPPKVKLLLSELASNLKLAVKEIYKND